jgi:hypothetical protein
MQDFNIDKALGYYLQEQNITDACKRHCLELGIEYSEKYRNRLSRYLRLEKPIDLNIDNASVTESNNYLNDKEKIHNGFNAIGDDNQLMNIESYCKHYGLDVSKIRSYKLISHSGIPFYNIVFYKFCIHCLKYKFWIG